MERINIDLSKYKELPLTYIKKLSGDKILTFDIIDQNGDIIFSASEGITVDSLKDRVYTGTRFFIPREADPDIKGPDTHEIIPKDSLLQLAEETYKTYARIRKNGFMTEEDYINTNKQITVMVYGLNDEDKHNGILTLLKEYKEFDFYTYYYA